MKGSNSIKSASIIMITMTLIVKVVGFIKSAIIAAYFGTSAEIDLFCLADSITNKLIFAIFSGLSLATITMYSSAAAGNEDVDKNEVVTALIKLVVISSLIVTCVILIIAPLIGRVMGGNYETAQMKVLVGYIRILSFTSVFYALATVFQAVLIANKKFLPGASLGLVQSTIIILAILFLSSSIGVRSIVVAYVFSYFTQALVLFLFARSDFKFKNVRFIEAIDLKRLFGIIAPLMLSQVLSEINVLIDQYISTGFGMGYVSALYYSNILCDFVIAIFIQAVSSTILPFLIQEIEQGNNEAAVDIFTKCNKFSTVVLTPVTIVTVFCSSTVISAVFQRGNFDGNSVMQTAYALSGYGIGFIFLALMMMVKRPFFAIENTRIPMISGLISVVLNSILSIVLGNLIGIIGVSLATSLTWLVTGTYMRLRLKRYFPTYSILNENLNLFRIVCCGIPLVIVCVFMQNLNVLYNPIIRFIAITVVSFITYIFVLRIAYKEEYDSVISIIKMRNKSG